MPGRLEPAAVSLSTAVVRVRLAFVSGNLRADQNFNKAVRAYTVGLSSLEMGTLSVNRRSPIHRFIGPIDRHIVNNSHIF